MFERLSQYSLLLVDSRLINAKFVSYNNWAPPPICLPSVYLTLLHVAKSLRPSPSIFGYCKQSKTGGRNEAMIFLIDDASVGLAQAHPDYCIQLDTQQGIKVEQIITFSQPKTTLKKILLCLARQWSLASVSTFM